MVSVRYDDGVGGGAENVTLTRTCIILYTEYNAHTQMRIATPTIHQSHRDSTNTITITAYYHYPSNIIHSDAECGSSIKAKFVSCCMSHIHTHTPHIRPPTLSHFL